MDLLEQVNGVLAAAESQMRMLIEEAVRAGQYQDVVVLARCADQLAAMQGGRARRAAPTAEDAGERGSVSGVEILVGGTRAPVTRPTTEKGYPRFSVAGDELLKTGWSKKLKREYEHRVSRNAVEAVLEMIVDANRAREVVAVADLLPVRVGNEVPEVPSYQVYVALGWLITVGVIHQHGRQGYSVPMLESAAERMKIEWARAKRRQMAATMNGKRGDNEER